MILLLLDYGILYKPPKWPVLYDKCIRKSMVVCNLQCLIGATPVNMSKSMALVQNVSSFTQGSILGPLLFIIYMNDINKSSDKFDFLLYADDTSLYCIINKFKNRNTNITNNMINKDICHITKWLESNKLSLNIDKTKAMLFHQPQKKISKPTLRINEKIIEFVPKFNFFGMNFNENLSWKLHIDNICNKISRSIGILNKLKHYIPLDIRINIYNSLILPSTMVYYYGEIIMKK